MAEVKNQASLKPTRKVAAATSGGGLAVVIALVAKQAGLDIDPVTATAIGTVLTFVLGFVKKEAK